MNFLSHMGATDPYPQMMTSQPSPRPQRRHTVTEHSGYRPMFLGGYSTSQRSGLNEIVLNEFSKGGGKYGHSRNPSTATAAERNSCYSNSKRGVVTETNNNHSSESHQPLLTTKTLLNPDDVDICSSYQRSCIEQLPDNHDCLDEGCQRVVINVSGLRFETQLRTLDRLPTTLLGDPEARAKYWDSNRQEFFFDRHRPTFQAVLYYYQSGGRLKRPLEVPMDIFLNEVHFYRLGGHIIDNFKRTEGYIIDEPTVILPDKVWKRKLWELVEYPESSRFAKVFACISISFIVASVITFCVETLPQFKKADCMNITVQKDDNTTITISVNKWVEPLFIAESCCITFFVFELVIRFITCPSKIAFLKESINWIDFIAITPYFVFLILKLTSDTCGGSHKSSVLSILRVIRVGRVFKLSKHSEGLKILGKTMKTSIRELSMFILFMGIATVIFSGAIFYAELGQEGCMFTSIPEAFWWAIVTMTTVGYGDYYPIGVMGKMIGSFCVLSGVLAIALPVPVIVANFNNYYRHYTASRGAMAWALIYRQKDNSLVEEFLDIEAKYVKHSSVPPPPKEVIYSNELPDVKLPRFMRRESIRSLMSRFSRKSSSQEQQGNYNSTTEESENSRLTGVKAKFKNRASTRSCPPRYSRRNSTTLDSEEMGRHNFSRDRPSSHAGIMINRSNKTDESNFRHSKFRKGGSLHSTTSRSSRNNSLKENVDNSRRTAREKIGSGAEGIGYNEIEGDDSRYSRYSKFTKRDSIFSAYSRSSTKSSSFEPYDTSSQTISQISVTTPSTEGSNENELVEERYGSSLKIPQFEKKDILQSSTPRPSRKNNKLYTPGIGEIGSIPITRTTEVTGTGHDSGDVTDARGSRRRKFKFKRRDSIRTCKKSTSMKEDRNPGITVSHIA